MPALARPAIPAPGIYRLGGTLHGCDCLIAYAPDGEFTIRTIEPGEPEDEPREQLRAWLGARGHTAPPANGGLFLVA
jgi:hypothetical protein